MSYEFEADDENNKTCDRCGEDGLCWEMYVGRWVLHDYETGKRHNCKDVLKGLDFGI